MSMLPTAQPCSQDLSSGIDHVKVLGTSGRGRV